MGYNHNLYVWTSDVSDTGFTVNGKFQAGQNSYNAYGFNAYTSVDGVGTNNHTIKINSRGASATFSNYYNVGQNGLNSRTFTVKVGADTSWSSNGCDSGNPVSTTVTVPARARTAHGKPTLSASKTSITYKENITLSWAKSSVQGNANFNRFELWQGGTKIYSGTGTSYTLSPYNYASASQIGGSSAFGVGFVLKEIHEWYGTYPETSTSIGITCRPQYTGFGLPTISSTSSSITYKQNVTLSWARSGTQGNSQFTGFELWYGNSKIYSGTGVNYTLSPYDFIGTTGGNATFTVKEVHNWFGNTYTTQASTTVYCRPQYIAHGNPTISTSKSTVNYGEQITLSWAKSGTQGNANFDRFELYGGTNKRFYIGPAVSLAVTPSDISGPQGGSVTYSILEIHEWYGEYKTTRTDITVNVRSGVVTAYDSSGKAHTGLVTAYDSSGKGHYVLITGYDSSGKAHSVV